MPLLRSICLNIEELVYGAIDVLSAHAGDEDPDSSDDPLLEDGHNRAASDDEPEVGFEPTT